MQRWNHHGNSTHEEVNVRTIGQGDPLVLTDYNSNSRFQMMDDTIEPIGAETNGQLLDTRWVNVWKVVKSRLTLRGFRQVVGQRQHLRSDCTIRDLQTTGAILIGTRMVHVWRRCVHCISTCS